MSHLGLPPEVWFVALVVMGVLDVWLIYWRLGW